MPDKLTVYESETDQEFARRVERYRDLPDWERAALVEKLRRWAGRIANCDDERKQLLGFLALAGVQRFVHELERSLEEEGGE